MTKSEKKENCENKLGKDIANQNVSLRSGSTNNMSLFGYLHVYYYFGAHYTHLKRFINCKKSHHENTYEDCVFQKLDKRFSNK